MLPYLLPNPFYSAFRPTDFIFLHFNNFLFSKLLIKIGNFIMFSYIYKVMKEGQYISA